MFKKKQNLDEMLNYIEQVAGNRIRKFAKSDQTDALHETIVAYLKDEDILEHLANYNKTEQRYRRKHLAFTRARPNKRDLAELKKISKEYH